MTVYCFNPRCQRRENSDKDSVCTSCGTTLLLQDRYQLIKPLRPIDGPIPQEIEVFECIDVLGSEEVKANTPFIIKILLVHDRQELFHSKRLKLLYRESEALKNVNHPGLPQAAQDSFFFLRDTGVAQEVYCLVQEKIEGQTLLDWLDAQGPISESLALDWMKQLADILNAVHAKGYFHRDIKPANIMIKPSGELVLIDFGAARDLTKTYLARISSDPLEDDYNHELEVTTIFTAGYAPPEQLNGKGLPQSDFYALGCTFIHLITGIHPNSLPSDHNTGKLLWRDKAKISKPFADFLDILIEIPPGKRPHNTSALLNYLNSKLPFKKRQQRVLRDRRFQALMALTFILLGLLGYMAHSKYLSEQYFLSGTRKLFESEFRQSKADLEKSIQLNPQNVESYTNLAVACQNLGDDDCTFKSFEKALAINPKSWPIYTQMGGFYDFRNQNDQAAKYYQKAIVVSEGKAVEAMNNLARIFILQGRYDEAIRLASESIEKTKAAIAHTKDPPDLVAAGYKNLGWAKLEKKQIDAAIVDLEKSSELNYGFADTYCLLEKAYGIKNNDEKATLNREICITSQSTTPEAYEWKLAIVKRLNP